MFKEVLEKQQPIVYHALENACSTHQVSSAYLFSGPYGTPKKEAAILLAQSIFCEQEGLACESCNTCRRVKENTYADLMVLDGSQDSISKDDIDAVQENFSKTALEKSGQRVYIILNAENASISAQNSMLKFLEEPGAGITAILTTDNINKILPTILSRCTILPFIPMSQAGYDAMTVEAGIPKEDAYFLSHIAKTMDDINALYPDYEEGGRKPSMIYESAVGMFKQYLDPEDRKDLLIDYDISWKDQSKDAKKAKSSNMGILNAFFQLLMMYGHDVILHGTNGPSWYQNKVKNAPETPEDAGELITIAAEQMDKVNRFNDLNLLMDQAFYRLEEYNHERGI